MINRVIILVILFSSWSCSLLEQKRLTTDLNKEIQRVCLNADGNGRLLANGRKVVFDFETAFLDDENKWVMALNFPLYGEEMIEFQKNDAGEFDYKSNFEEKILKNNDGINPEHLKMFMIKWASFINEVIRMQKGDTKNLNYQWGLSSKVLRASLDIKSIESSMEINFTNIIYNKYFGRFDIAMQSKNNDHNLKLELIVRECLENQ